MSPIVAACVVSSVTGVTLRDDVRAALDSGGSDALDALGDLAPELVGTALGHFADTSTLADADALAPIVVVSSPVPVDLSLDGAEAEPSAVTSVDADPDDFDRGDDPAEAVDDLSDGSDVDNININADVRNFETGDAAFGAGDASLDPSAESDDAFENAGPVIEPFLGDDSFGSAAGVIDEMADEMAGDVVPIEPAGMDADPADGDFDIFD